MIHSELLADQAVLVLTPAGPLTAADFTRIAAVVDPYIEQHGKLKGLLIHASSFPGWDDFAALVSHLRFVRDHHKKIERIAVATDSAVLSTLPRIASHFVAAKVRHFDYADRGAALRWLAHDIVSGPAKTGVTCATPGATHSAKRRFKVGFYSLRPIEPLL